MLYNSDSILLLNISVQFVRTYISLHVAAIRSVVYGLIQGVDFGRVRANQLPNISDRLDMRRQDKLISGLQLVHLFLVHKWTSHESERDAIHDVCLTV